MHLCKGEIYQTNSTGLPTGKGTQRNRATTVEHKKNIFFTDAVNKKTYRYLNQGGFSCLLEYLESRCYELLPSKMLPFEYLVPSVIKINKLQKNPTTKASPAMSILPLKCSNCWPQIFHRCLYFRQTWISSLRKQSKDFRLLALTVYYNEVQNPSLFELCLGSKSERQVLFLIGFRLISTLGTLISY